MMNNGLADCAVFARDNYKLIVVRPNRDGREKPTC